MITEDEISEIVRAYFQLRYNIIEYNIEQKRNHQVVVDILKQYPEYANHFLTSKERGDDE